MVRALAPTSVARALERKLFLFSALVWPGFDSRTRRHMWVEFVVGSRPCSKCFSPGSLVFLPPQKPKQS